MPLSTREIMEALAIVAEHENVKVAVRKSVTGGVITCLTTICGGLLAGRFGMALGSTVGGITAYIMNNNFKPLPQILMEDLSVHQKEELVRSVRTVVNNIRVEDAVMLATLIVGNKTLSKTVLQLVVNFLRTQM
ncbi:protein C19orf12 homolog [Schistocerca gregaria]|uniref:protein C19orf12 homolog n=1 Tax=Schistocerca gregaria TaxID=7010 RepID=UPI00211F2DFB|nr:protein C19orf12 homolog [Schistocerca gregaria]XP_049836585.1 protein C19orf12 homolog [Schistocerca gregaria]